MRGVLSILIILSALGSKAQREPDMTYNPNIRSVKFHRFGEPASLPILTLNSPEQLELHFDDMAGDVKYYFYTLELRNADWTPVQMSYFDYVKGYTQQRISTYRTSAALLSRYTHYQATLPDRNLMPSKSGNYLLKVFINGDTSKLAFTRRILVVDRKFPVATQVQQPFSQQYFRTHHRLLVQVSHRGFDIRYPQQQIRLMVLQNNRWDNAKRNVQPTYIKQDLLEFVNEQEMLFPAMREWRWANLRSFRLLGDRIRRQQNTDSSFSVLVTEDKSRAGMPYFFFRDLNGMFLNETVERLNPLWEADYAKVRFTYLPPDGQPFNGRDLHVFGELSNYGKNPESRMIYNEQKKVYEAEWPLKQGYYDYIYALRDPRTGIFETLLTEGNTWETEDLYTVLVYYRELGGRYDQLLGISIISSPFARPQ
jgi:hypothetical protein